MDCTRICWYLDVKLVVNHSDGNGCARGHWSKVAEWSMLEWTIDQVTKGPSDQVTKGRERFCWKPKCQICGLPLLVASVNSHLSPQTLTLMGWWVTSCLCQTFQPGGVNFLLSWRSQPQPQMLNGDFREAFLFQNAWFFWLLERGAVGHLKN